MPETVAEHGLTTGPIYKKMLLFAIPVLISNFFQQLYNTVDALIVGNAIDEKAIAAVSAGSSIIFLITGFVHGMSVGAGVIIARHFGAKHWEKLEKSIHTTMALSFIIGVVLTVISMVCTPMFLKLLGTPSDVLPSSISYFRIYCGGTGFLVISNFGTGVLQSVGNSKHPMYFLMTSTITNIILDMVFILGFGWGVEGAAVASLIAMIINALLILTKLFTMGRKKDPSGLVLKKIRIDKSLLAPLIRQGVPSGLQNSVISLSHLVIQSSINLFGSSAMAGCASYSRIEGFVFLPIVCFVTALTTFISQNMGAGLYDRAKKSMKYGILSSVILAQIIGFLMIIFAPFLISLFSSSPEVIEVGANYMRTAPLFYFLLAYSHSCAGILRGMEKPCITMIIFLGAWCVFRIAFVVIGIRLFYDIRVIYWAYPAAWGLSSLIFTPFVIKYKNKLLGKSPEPSAL